VKAAALRTGRGWISESVITRRLRVSRELAQWAMRYLE